MRNWELFDKLIEVLGAEEVALSICKAMDMDNMNEILEYIATSWEINTED